MDGNRRKLNLKIFEKLQIYIRLRPVYATPTKIESVHTHLTMSERYHRSLKDENPNICPNFRFSFRSHPVQKILYK